MEDAYLPAREWRRRVETWRQVNDWLASLRQTGHYAPDPDGGISEEIRARIDEQTLRELVIPWYEKRAGADAVER